MLRQVAVLMALVAVGHAWVLEASHARIAKQITTNITLTCRYDGRDNGRKTLVYVNRVRILKFQGGMEWALFAKVSNVDNKVRSPFSGIQTSGKAGHTRDSFLTLRFDDATDDVIGLFKCEADGYDVDDEVTSVTTDQVNITERAVSYEDLLDMILKVQTEEAERTYIEDRIGALESAVQLLESQGTSRSDAISQISQDINANTTSLLKMIDDVVKKQQIIIADLEEMRQSHELQTMAWPEGTWVLPRTTHGCPSSSTFRFIYGNLLIATSSGSSNNDSTSESIHLSQAFRTVGNNHWFFMELCSKGVDSAGPGWPMGDYCFLAFNETSCPSNFGSGYVNIDRENLLYQDRAANFYGVSRNRDVTTLFFCCRGDGTFNIPIRLPIREPFYLFPYKTDNCQEVVGMDVTYEWVHLDTKRAKDGISARFSPAADISDGVRFGLCYYTPRVQH